MVKILKIILLFDTSVAYSRQVLRGIAKYSRYHGPWTFYRESGRRKKTLTLLKNWGADGVIVFDSERADEILSLGLPTITNSAHKKNFPHLPYLSSDSTAMGKMGAKHFLERGFQNFAYCGFDFAQWSKARGKAFCEQVALAGFKVHVYKQSRGLIMRFWDKEQPYMTDWLLSLPKPVGIMACNDERGQDIIESCKIGELHVPDDIAVLGIDNDDLICDLTEPPLSSIVLDAEKAGYRAAKMLDLLIAGEKMDDQKITVHPTHIVVRQSTDTLATNDSDVVNSLRFIRRNSKKIIQVSDVVKASCLSRRDLYKRFKKITGRSVNREIRRVRTEEIVKMLIETNKSISQIALELGWKDVAHISRYFRLEKGISALEYRKLYGRL